MMHFRQIKSNVKIIGRLLKKIIYIQIIVPSRILSILLRLKYEKLCNSNIEKLQTAATRMCG